MTPQKLPEAPIVHPLDVSFVLAVTAAAMLFPWLALAVAAGYFGLNAYLARAAERQRPPT